MAGDLPPLSPAFVNQRALLKRPKGAFSDQVRRGGAERAYCFRKMNAKPKMSTTVRVYNVVIPEFAPKKQ